MAFGDFIQAATAIDTSGTSATIGGAGFTSNVTAGNWLVCGVRVGNSGTSASLTSDSTPASFTKAKEQNQGNDVHTSSVHHGINQAGAVKPTITISNPSSGTIRAVLCEYAGSPNTHVDVTASDQGTSATPASGATATRADATELQIGFESNGNGNAATAGSLFTIRSTQPANKCAIEDVLRTTTGTQQADFTLTSTQWACLTATYSDSGGGGGGGGPLIRGGELLHGSLIRGGRLVADA